MNSVKNITLGLCLLFLIGCIGSSSKSETASFDATKISFDGNTHDILILGGGPAGLTAAIYSAQAGLNPLVLVGPNPGGNIAASDNVQNWPGELEIVGKDLTEKIRKQALENGVRILDEEAISVDFSSWPYKVKTKGLYETRTTSRKALSCIIAMGASPNLLDVPGIETYWGKGVSSCAICDGPLYKDKVVAIVGGGNAAVTECAYLSKMAKKVYMILRSERFRAVGRLPEEVVSRSNVEVLYENTVQEIVGNGDQVTYLKILDKKSKKVKKLSVDGLFLAIGYKPNTDIFKNQIELDQSGYIELKDKQETSKPGIYAIGDIANPEYKQVVIAAGNGAVAALQAQSFLDEIGYNPKEITRVKSKAKRVKKPKKEKAKIQKPQVMSTDVKEVDGQNDFDNFVIKSDIPVIVDFYADWCGPCKRVAPIFKQLSTQIPGVKFVKVNIGRNKSIANKMGVSSIPAFFVFKNGKKVTSIVGAGNIKSRIMDITRSL